MSGRTIEDDEQRDPLVERALRLFEFLARAQQLKAKPPRTLDAYQRDGSVLWLGDVPHHPAVTSAARGGDPEPDAALLSIDRVAKLAPAQPGEELAPWLDGAWDDPDRLPQLRDALQVKAVTPVESPDAGYEPRRDVLASTQLHIDMHPEVRAQYDRWADSWRIWADQEQRDRPVREAYGELFSTYVTSTGHPEEMELVVGMGCLAWTPEGGHPPARRHLLTAPAVIDFDDDSGRLTLRRGEGMDPLTVELDMLDPGMVTNPQLINDVRADARSHEDHPLHRGATGTLVRRLVHSLDANGSYRDDDTAPTYSPNAKAAFAPALILRKRSGQGLVDIFSTIVAQLAEAGEVPDGVLPLVDPDHRPEPSSASTEGAVIGVDSDAFLPLPVNDVQLRIIRQVDTAAQTLVQGPPGTGKTHTAAALISHLLAQGLRVLVTAHTDRALKEVRDKLPMAIKPLSVAVVGSSREDMSDLKVAVERIAATAGEHDPEAAAETVRTSLEQIDQLRRRRATLYRELVSAREQEVVSHHHGDYRGTLAGLALQHQDEADQFSWLADYAPATPTEEPPLTTPEIAEWRTYLLDERLIADEAEARQRLVDLDTLPAPAGFADLVAAETGAITADDSHTALRAHAAFTAVSVLDDTVRNNLQRRLHKLAEEADDLDRRRETWMNHALADVKAGRSTLWVARGRQVGELIDGARPLVEQLGPIRRINAPQDQLGALTTMATNVRHHLAGGARMKTGPDGTPRFNALTPRVLKQSSALFDHVRVDGVAPTTSETLDAFLTWARASNTLDALDRAWPDNVDIPAEDTLYERLQWHITELEQLRRVLALAEALEAEEQQLASLGLPRPDWHDLEAVRTYARLIDAASAADARAAATAPVEQLEERLVGAARWKDAAATVHRFLLAVRSRDLNEYEAAHRRIQRLHQVRSSVERRDALADRLSREVPGLRHAVQTAPADPSWDARLGAFSQAWAWLALGEWIQRQHTLDVNVLQAEVTLTEERIRAQVETVAATRAWAHAVSPGRLTGKARADLEHYAGLVRRLGKGTGKYAAQIRGDIRKAMDRCRPAVPVWVMPVYRIAQQLEIHPNMFDVVIVDEASQAGLEATFLQYLAPRMVVIGDDKQVSPTAVGIDQQQLRDLANQYLADDPYKASWENPQRSLFDEAKMRYGGLITLTEHRRCVPEIIGFSNRVAYEPDGIRLIPVRQYGVDRLDPIKAVFLSDGYVQGSSNKVNPVEVDAIVDQVEKCTADPRYDGLTFGVISLLGGAQAKAIEKALLERIPPEEWTARDLRCGDSADFQGSERDVMFLSMVAAPEPGKRLGALTRDLFLQRYNVAASRAKDQMWLFHSVSIEDVGSPEDMRFLLLDYCYGVINRAASTDDGVVSSIVPEDVRVEPFDSLFEQRVFNRLIDRGYTVIPQYPVEPYRLDLVVVGAKSRLAIECDGDAWHGPDAYEQDLARQRDLERCGWQFFRIRESTFYVDQAASLGELWSTLNELDIHPSGWTSERPTDLDGDLGDVIEETLPDIEDALEEDLDEPPPANAAVGAPDEPDRPSVSWSNPTQEAPPVARTAALQVPETNGEALGGAAAGSGRLEQYEAFTGAVVPAQSATRRQLLEGLAAVAAAEGPVVGRRLHAAYVTGSGGQRVGKQIAKALNSAITSAVRQGILVEDNPLGEPGVKPRTYRLPGQSDVRLRTLGPRSLEDVPPRELASLMAALGDDLGWDNDELLFREVLNQLGLKRLTTNTQTRLETVLLWVHEQKNDRPAANA